MKYVGVGIVYFLFLVWMMAGSATFHALYTKYGVCPADTSTLQEISRTVMWPPVLVTFLIRGCVETGPKSEGGHP